MISKKILLTLLFSMIFVSGAFAQRKNFDSLSSDSAVSFEPDDPSIFYKDIIQRGWFPKYINFRKFYGISLDDYFILEKATNVKSKYLGDIGAYFSSGSPISDGDKLEIVKDPKTGEKESSSPERSGGGFSLSYGFCVPNAPLFFQIDAFYANIESQLYHLDKSKHYLDFYGNLCSIDELNILDLNQHFIGVAPQIKLSLWGANMDFGKMGMSSVYYLNLGANFAYSVQSRFTQYSQIVSDKNNIRYENGKDTLNFINNKYLDNINKYRVGAHIGLGMGTIIAIIRMDFELFYEPHLNKVIKDANWRNNLYGFKFGLMLDL